MSVTIYATGGTGVNIGMQVADLDTSVHFIDTSNSNLAKHRGENVYLVEGMDGAGKDQSVTYNHFKGQAGDVLTKFKPSEHLNIVVTSLTGGSGAILGALIAKELITQDFNTVVIGVISRSSLVELRNARNALMTYKAMSKQTDRCYPIFIIDEEQRTDADRQALGLISVLTLISDKRRTAEFDTSDLRSFLFFDKVTKNPVSVPVLEISANDEVVPEKGTSVVSTILVTTRKEATIRPVIPEHLSTCVVVDELYTQEDLRINSVLGKHALVVESLDRQIAEMSDQKRINKVREIESVESNEDGIVLG